MDEPRWLSHSEPRKRSDVQVVGAEVYFLPIETRMPLKFGAETLTHVTLGRVALTVQDRSGRRATGWGETPLSVQWGWPSASSYAYRFAAMRDLCLDLAKAWCEFRDWGHPLELGADFHEHHLGSRLASLNRSLGGEPMPQLAALIVSSCHDIALHDAYGRLHGIDVYRTYSGEYLNSDLSAFLTPEPFAAECFAGKYPADYLDLERPKTQMRAWHLVGGLDPLEPADLTGTEPNDGEPVCLTDWIERDGLTCLKVKLRGNDAPWDYERLVRVSEIAVSRGVEWLTADFNCTVHDPAYVNSCLDRLRDEHPRYYGMMLYVEQPFPYDLEANRIEAGSVSARKPLFLDESAHDWRFIRLGRRLGWSGVALKTCKTQTGALLSLCWAKAHGMPLMVQDLSNPMLAQIPHLRLASVAGTIMGVETNGMQFYPRASDYEAAVHPGMYRRRNGIVDLSTLGPVGMGYREDEIARPLPEAAWKSG